MADFVNWLKRVVAHDRPGDPSGPAPWLGSSRAVTRRQFCLAFLGTCGLTLIGLAGFRLRGSESEASHTLAPAPPPVVNPSEAPQDFLMEALRPFVEDAQRTRARRAEADPDFAHRVDQGLNANRVNFLLYTEGITYEPTGSDADVPVRMGIHTIISLDVERSTVDSISLTHDIRAPEIERHRRAQGIDKGPAKIFSAYEAGGFDLMRRTVENATGLAIDYQFYLDEAVIGEVVDHVYEGLWVELPFDLDTGPVVVGDTLYENIGTFRRGREKMTGLRVIQFIKANARTYDRSKERNIRKHIVVDALVEQGRQNAGNPLFLAHLSGAMAGWVRDRKLVADFDAARLLLDNVWEMGLRSARFLIRPGEGGRALGTGKHVYVVDARSGDGGVEWVQAAAARNPIIREELERGLYIDEATAVPIDGDPNAPDLPRHYWGSVRRLIKSRLSGTSDE